MIFEFGICSECLTKISDTEKGLTCLNCDLVYHGTCAGLDEMPESPDDVKHWVCSTCAENPKNVNEQEVEDRHNEWLEVLRKGNIAFENVEITLALLRVKYDYVDDLILLLKKENNACELRLLPGHKRREYLTALSVTMKETEDDMKSNHKDAYNKIINKMKEKNIELTTNQKLLIWMETSQWLFQVFAIAIVALYTVLGTVVFYFAEGWPEKWNVEEVLKRRNDCMKEIDVLKEAQYEAQTENNQLEGALHAVGSYGEYYREQLVTDQRLMKEGDDIYKWRVGNTIFFSYITYSALGYGGIYPTTVLGKILVMVYSSFGIPLFLMFLMTIGSAILKTVKTLYYKFWNKQKGTEIDEAKQKAEIYRQKRHKPPIPTSSAEDTEYTLFWIILSMEIFYTFLGTIIFWLITNWSYWESFYFVSITVLLIGFGDYVPTDEMVKMVSLFYFITGLALTSTCIYLIIEKVEATLHEATDKIRKVLIRHKRL